VSVPGEPARLFPLVPPLSPILSPTSPTNTHTASGDTNWAAIDLTSRGHVAEKKSVCRDAGIWRTMR